MSLADRLGSLTNTKPDDTVTSPKQEDGTEGTVPHVQRIAILQRDEKGYGLTVSGDNPVYVASVKLDGAAAKAGVQKGDKIIKVNGKLVTNSNHTEVVKLIKSGSYVALTLLGKPASGHSSRDSTASDTPSFRDSYADRITAPLPVDAEKDQELRQSRANTIRQMYTQAVEEYEKLKGSHRGSASEKYLAQLAEKERTVKALSHQLRQLTDSQNFDSDSVSGGTSSMPSGVSDTGSMSDSPYTSPSTSPTPLHPQNMDPDSGVPHDSGIDDGSQTSVNTAQMRRRIIRIDDDDFNSEDESSEHSIPPVSPFLHKLQQFETGECREFADVKALESRAAAMSIFLNYVLTQHDPSAVLFHYLSGVYYSNPSSLKEMKKWAYEIGSTFIFLNAPLKVNLDELVTQEVERTLQFRGDKEEALRTVFLVARHSAQAEMEKLLEDLRQKKEKGLIEGSNELRENMDKSEELKIAERLLVPHLEKAIENPDDEKLMAQSWAIATFLRQIGLKSQHSASVLERTQSFISKDKRGFKSLNKKSKAVKGHNFALQHFSKTEICMQCNRVLWGVGFQGFQCQTCDQCIHKGCLDDLEESCSKKRAKGNRSSGLLFKKNLPMTGGHGSSIFNFATPINAVNETEPVISPTNPTMPTIHTQPVKKPEDEDLSAFQEQGHSVIKMVSRFDKLTQRSPGTSPERDGSEKTRKGTDLGRSESMKGRTDRDNRPARRSKSDVDMDEQTIRMINQSESSSTSSISNRSMESPSSSMDTLTQQIQDDSDFDVEPDLPSLKQVLGEETVRRLKPKEKKRQDVINELFYTEKCHVRNLKILDKLFYRPMLKDHSIPQEFTKSIFPNLETMISLHSFLNSKMKARRREKPVISCVGDILLQRFDEEGENFRNGCAIFCRNQSHALESLKARVRKEPKMAQLLADAENNPLCQRLALKDIIPKQIMRLTKYPLLIENLLKYTQTNTEEYTNLERSLQCSKHILEYVNQAVKDCENHQRLIDLQRRIDKKLDDSPGMEEIKAFDLIKHKLVHDGALTWQINNRKSIELHVILLEKAMVLLQKQEDRLVLKSQSITLVAGKEDNKRHSPLMWLNNVLARDDATDKKSFFVVNTSKAGPQIYKLVAGSADEQKRWTKFITQAADAMKKSEISAKKKPAVTQAPAQQEVREVKEQIARPKGDEDLTVEPLPDYGNMDVLVHPEDVQCSNPIIATSAPVLNPLEQLQENGEKLEAVLEERQDLIAQLLKVTPGDLQSKVETIDKENSKPQDLIVACQQQTTQLLDMVKDGTLGALTAQQHAAESGEGLDDIEGLTMPIPMERLREMAHRMNQILTNLLAQTRATSSMTTQAAVNTGEDERNKLRNELKFAQEELNRLRRIQRIAGSLNETGPGEVQGRPASLVSENSTISESGDEQREDENQTEPETTDTNDDINEESVKTLEAAAALDNSGYGEISQATLTEVSPGNIETYPENDIEIELEPDEDLQEMEPPEEDEIEDLEPPDFQIDLPDGSGADPEGTYQGEEGDGDEICQVTDFEPDELEKLSQYETTDGDDLPANLTIHDPNGSASDTEQKVDDGGGGGGDGGGGGGLEETDGAATTDNGGDRKPESGDVFHDAPDVLDSNNKGTSSNEDEDDDNGDDKNDNDNDDDGTKGRDKDSEADVAINGVENPTDRTCDGEAGCVESDTTTEVRSVEGTDCANGSSSTCDSSAGLREEVGDQSCESKDTGVTETDTSVTGLENTTGSEEV